MAVTAGRLDQSPLNYPTNLLSSKSSTFNFQAKLAKPVVTASRIDLEPLYTTLKEAIADSWGEYKEALRLFILGYLNQDEFSRRINRFICVEPSREHCHNQLVSGIFGNASRDPPEQLVASWVSANDKPRGSLKPVVGDIAEQRLKTEILMLTARERYRLKNIQDVQDRVDSAIAPAVNYYAAKQIKLPDIVASSAGGLNKTNWDLEIRKRFAQPLFSEATEFPDPETIQARMLPICYEEGITAGCANGCADLMNVATENYVKELISNILVRIRSNGDHYVKTATYRQQLQREEDAWLQGGVTRSSGGLLPVEVVASEARHPLALDDMRLALCLGDAYIGQSPLMTEKIASGDCVKGEEARTTPENQYSGEAAISSQNRAASPSAANRLTAEDQAIASFVHDWPGGMFSDRQALNVVLDDCLTVG